ncbi:hypothetical protein [Pyrobaculum aerophilum]|uniref:hypothetical protein n=1 Tax=Pyrobaculum aerophilum TaxID=13773 RepID=UPI0023F06100|nr:hypothetical protein [Pyrobaculum aerophilum]MCX8137669.1 hypothetical protein [Pyrobaculum aerophilum]
MNIAIVIPRVTGGVKTTSNKLINALRYEKISLDVYLMKNWHDRLKLEANNYDAVIFLGSIPPISSLSVSVPKLLFVHGFIRHEAIGLLRQYNPRSIMGGLSMLIKNEFYQIFEKFDAYICRSYTTCEANKIIDRKHIILPHFIIDKELARTEEVFNKKNKFLENMKNKDYVSIIGYLSHAHSPRLLTIEQFISLAKILDKKIKRKVLFSIIDPHVSSIQIKESYKIKLMIIPFIRRAYFLKLLYNSDLYLERCIDEELGSASLEAGLLGTPVAKITHTNFLIRQDYTSNEILVASSLNDFVEKLAEYINDIEYFEPLYSIKLRQYIIHKRHWNSVKAGLINYLRQIT